jgi:two-component system, cell cycle sensor histidine kinase and response regulator CckA
MSTRSSVFERRPVQRTGEHPAPARTTLPWRDRLSTRLVLVMLPMLTALLATGLWHARLRFRDSRAAATARNAAVAAEIVSRLQIRANEARALLTGVASALSDDPAHVEQNEAVLVDVLERSARGFADLWMSDAQGTVVARASSSSTRGVNVADRPYFQQAMTSGEFVTSEPLRGKSSNQWGVVFALPVVRAGSTRPSAVVSVSMRARAFADLLDVPLPPDSYVTLTDSAGRIVYRTIDPDRHIGTSVPVTDSLLQLVQRLGTVSTERRSVVDGVVRMSTHRRVDGTRWQLSVGVPTKTAMANVRRELTIESMVIGCTILVAAILAWYLARRLGAPLEALTRDVLDHATGQRTRRQIETSGEVGILSAAFDHLVTQVDSREQALAETARRYEQLFDATPLPILEWDLQSRMVVAANAAALRFYGLTRDVLKDTRVDALLDVNELQAFPADGGSLGEGVSRAFPSMMHRTAGGSALEVESHATIVRSPRGLVVLHAALDLSARRTTERALEESREQLRQSQKLESLGAFSGGIAHDFNNHLAAILGFCELAQARVGLPPSALKDLDEISQAAGRAAELTRQLLVFAKRQPIALQPLHLGALIDNLGPSMQQLVRDPCRLHLEIASELPIVRGDRSQVEQIVMNLVTNARDAMPHGGDITVSVVADASTVTLAVRDTGLGMSPDVAARVFEPFFTTKSRSKGSGLGLSIVYSSVQRMQGELRLDSVVDRGTTITIVLPADQTVVPATSETVTAVSRPASVIRATVLLVDDDTAVRQMTRAMLERLECQVTDAASGAEALDLAARMGGRFDVLLTDMVMPGMDGRELASAVQASYPLMRVAYMSGYTEDKQFQTGHAADAAHFLSKPFTMQELSARLRAVLDRAPDPMRRVA